MARAVTLAYDCLVEAAVVAVEVVLGEELAVDASYFVAAVQLVVHYCYTCPYCVDFGGPPVGYTQI